MFRRWIACLLILFLVAMPLQAQQGQYGWCGYALIEGLPLLEGQLAVFEAITPPASSSVNPFELFQYRFSLDHTKVLIEGCFGVPPDRTLIEVLLAHVIPASPALIQSVQDAQVSPSVESAQLAPAQLGSIDQATEDIEPTATIDPGQAVLDYIDENLTLTIFAPGGTDQESAAAARAYLQANDAEWDPPPDP